MNTKTFVPASLIVVASLLSAQNVPSTPGIVCSNATQLTTIASCTQSTSANINWGSYTMSESFEGAPGSSMKTVHYQPSSTNIFTLEMHVPYSLAAGDIVPVFVRNFSGGVGISAPWSSQSDYTWQEGINLAPGSGVLNTSIGGIGVSMESSYQYNSRGMAQELHLVQNFANNTGSNRFLSYNGVQDGSYSQLGLQAYDFYVNTPTETQIEKISVSGGAHILYGGLLFTGYDSANSKHYGLYQNGSYTNLIAYNTPLYLGALSFGAAFNITNPTGNFLLNITGSAVTTAHNTLDDGAGNVNVSGVYESGGSPGYTGTKTIGSCTFTIKGGIITNITGC